MHIIRGISMARIVVLDCGSFENLVLKAIRGRAPAIYLYTPIRASEFAGLTPLTP